MTKLNRADMVAWVAAVYRTRDADQWVQEGRAAFRVCVDDGQSLLVRRSTGGYWAFPGMPDLYKAGSDWRLRHALRKLFIDPDEPAGTVHDPSQDLTERQLRDWLDITYGQDLVIGQILDGGWAFLAIKGQITFGCDPGTTSRSATLAVIKRTGEVWDLSPGPQAEAAFYARTEAGFRGQIGWRLHPIAQIPR